MTYADLLSQIFSVDAVRSPRPGGKGPRGGKPPTVVPPPPPPPKIPQKQRWFTVTQTAGGFRIKGSTAAPLPANATLRVRVAYDLGGSNKDSLRAWSPFEFTLDNRPANSVKFRVDGATMMFTKDAKGHGSNLMHIKAVKPDFVVEAKGFANTSNTDLLIRLDDISPKPDTGTEPDTDDVAEKSNSADHRKG